MAGGYSEARQNKPALVSLHTSAGTGNAMGTIVTAFLTKIPLVIVAGQQTREMLIGEPMLANREAATLPRPYIKCPPMGPVYISVPLDDWDVPYTRPVIPRSVSTRFGPDPERLKQFAERIHKAQRPALVLGAEVDKALAWDTAVAVAELLACPVFQAPMCERAVFPETHEQHHGPLPTARGPLAQYLDGFDLVIVIGAEVFRYYPWVAGPVLVDGTELLHITNDPNDAAKALICDSLLSDAGLALNGLHSLLKSLGTSKQLTKHYSHHENVLSKSKQNTSSGSLMTPLEAFSAVAEIRPSDTLLVHETPSSTADLVQAWPSTEPETCFTFASGGLGWNMPAAVGVAVAQKTISSGRLTVLVVGDGSFQYSLQCLYTAVQNQLRLIVLVPVNEEYAVLKEFAVLEETPRVPHLDIPGLDISASARSWGCSTFKALNRDELQRHFRTALTTQGPVVIEFPVDRTLRPLVAQTLSRG
ncbi:hypothetical protein M409DRAFT_63776 [Zasmidium cellare ATCC 36951]|uniref:Uncharacterized protein n=1 Tax=Zasmidium cellare ATCC 36951 TaxID=1080233 RepID=A0A6A6D066_ZASCE|nr:uncharacterized protein M409DRAFT_63776 [Zasmidium cellare ATCC 36951]KAF2171552.1 hypothetical protein M409DRAFT_63776 [Zasmidium cellare ATCC 36951]